LLPDAMDHLGYQGEVLWRTSSALLFIFSAIFLVTWILSSRRFFRVARELFNLRSFD
jgi:hypothetical protein